MSLRQKQTTVHLLPSFHYDVAYLKTFKGYLPESLKIIKEALKLLKRHRDFTYCIEQVILLREYWKRYPADRVLLRKFARQGRLVFAPGMFTMPDTNIPSGESFVRNALIGRKWLKDNLEVEPECCWMADIFGHNPQSPQLAGACGYRLFMFERGKSGTWDTTFNWKGIDGSKIATQWEIDSYAGMYLVLAFADRPYAWLANRVRTETIGLLKKHGAAPQTVFTTLGHDFLPPKQEYIDFLRKWNRQEHDIKFVFSTPYRYLAALHKQKVPLKTLSEDMNPLCEGCFSSRIRIKQYNRRLEETAASLEMLECLAGGSYRESEALWEVLAHNAFHDIICGSLVTKAAEETLKMYAMAEKRAGKASRILLAKVIRLKASANPSAAKLLFNSLPYPRREIVELKHHKFIAIDLPTTGFAVSPGNAGKNVLPDAVKVGVDGMSLENRLLRVKLV